MQVESVDWPDEPVDQSDPAAQATEPGHFDPPSTTATVLESQRSGDVDESPQQPQETKTPKEFDPRVRQSFDGLLYLGRLEDTFDVYGHEFVIRTMTTDEVLEVGLIIKPWQGTTTELRAYQAAMVAACVTRVDGRPISIPLTNDPSDSPLRNRFDYIRQHWFPPVLDVVYEHYLELENEVEKVLGAMGEASR